MLIRPLPGPLGAEITCNVAALDGDEERRIAQAFLDHLVLVFPDQQLSREQLSEFSRIFGAPEAAAVKDDLYQELVLISNVIENGRPIGALGAGELLLHSDHSFNEHPLSASILYALEVPAEGGDTSFSNMYLALETLSAELRARAEGRTIRNDPRLNSAGEQRASAGIQGPSHPIVRTHPQTLINALYLGRRPNATVDGLPPEESELLLEALWAHASAPRFSLAHHWRVGDIVVWDNRCVMHRREAFNPTERRTMLRAQCSGDRPTYQPEVVSRAAHPRAYQVQ